MIKNPKKMFFHNSDLQGVNDVPGFRTFSQAGSGTSSSSGKAFGVALLGSGLFTLGILGKDIGKGLEHLEIFGKDTLINFSKMKQFSTEILGKDLKDIYFKSTFPP